MNSEKKRKIKHHKFIMQECNRHLKKKVSDKRLKIINRTLDRASRSLKALS